MLDFLIPISVFIGVPYVLVLAYRANLAHQRFMKVLQVKSDTMGKIIDRFGQEPGALEFLKSDAPRELFDVKLPDASGGIPDGYGRMLTAMQAGAVLLPTGVVLLLFARRVGEYQARDAFFLFSALGIGLGIGCLLAAAAADLVIRRARNQARDGARA